MFFVREARIDDAPTLLKLAKMVHFINLPADPDIIKERIRRSRLSFAGQMTNDRERQFLFVLVDSNTGNVVGTSLIVSHISWPGKPNVCFRVRKREHYSEDLQTGAIHVTLQLEMDESGPTEIGGLILSPSYRGHPERLGSILSLIRFHYIGLHREWFSDQIKAEMMAPLTPDSRNTLWEYLGRRFINLSYIEADRFCQHSKEFMLSLLPRDEIYVSLLPPEARNLIGKVGSETEPAKRMLEKIGFEYRGQVDPFDGGPYLEAAMDDLALVRGTERMTLGRNGEEGGCPGFVSVERDGRFCAVRTECEIDGGQLCVPPGVAQVLEVQPGDSVGFSGLEVGAGAGGPDRKKKATR